MVFVIVLAPGFKSVPTALVKLNTPAFGTGNKTVVELSSLDKNHVICVAGVKNKLGVASENVICPPLQTVSMLLFTVKLGALRMVTGF